MMACECVPLKSSVGLVKSNPKRSWLSVSKIADSLEVSIDYLIGKTKMEMEQWSRPQARGYFFSLRRKQKFILNMIDMALRDFKTKKAYAK